MKAKNCGCVLIGMVLSGWLPARGVTFLFNSSIATVYGPGADTISNLVMVGMPCTGTVSYNLNAASSDGDPSTNSGAYQFNGPDMQIFAKVGTNVFSSTDLSSGSIRVAYQLPSPVSDGVTYEIHRATLNGAEVPGATDSQTLDVELSTTNLSALASDLLPTQAPLLSSYPIGGGTGFLQVVFYTYKNGSFNYGFSGPLTSIMEVPALSTKLAAGQLVLSWTTNASGFQLESSSTPASLGSWLAVAGKPAVQNENFQLSVLLDSTSRFFRLNGSIANPLVK